MSSKKAPKETPTSSDGLCTFAIRISKEDRDLIHQAAGPGKATRFVRDLVVAEARRLVESADGLSQG